MKQQAPEGYGFCAVCGGLFKLRPDHELPPHGWVGHAQQLCPGTEVVQEGEISP